MATCELARLVVLTRVGVPANHPGIPEDVCHVFHSARMRNSKTMHSDSLSGSTLRVVDICRELLGFSCV